MIPHFTASESGSGIVKKLKIRLRIWIQGRNHNTSNRVSIRRPKFTTRCEHERQNFFTSENCPIATAAAGWCFDNNEKGCSTAAEREAIFAEVECNEGSAV